MDGHRDYEATTEGQRAGRLRLPASLNPYHHTDPRHGEWERTRFQTLGQLLARAA